jgi:hypothetical protein
MFRWYQWFAREPVAAASSLENSSNSAAVASMMASITSESIGSCARSGKIAAWRCRRSQPGLGGKLGNALEGEARLFARIRFDTITRPLIDGFSTILRY